VRRAALLVILLAACDARDVFDALAHAGTWLARTTASSGVCDRATLAADGMSAIQRSDYHVAMMRFERAVHCGSARDDKLVRLLVTASCYAKDEGRAQRYFADLAERDKQSVALLCQTVLHPCVYATQSKEFDRP
jgi:hypothetical protein